MIDTFHLWAYDSSLPTANKIRYLGWIDVDSTKTSINGDMALDAAGNLFVVWGTGDYTTAIFTITASTIENAVTSPGNVQRPASKSATFNATITANGAAFDTADGKFYLGSSSQIRRYNVPRLVPRHVDGD